MLLSVLTPGSQSLPLPGGFVRLRQEHSLVAPAVGWALFDSSSHLLGSAGQVEVHLLASLDGREYAIRRSLEVADHWQVVDVESGWLAAAGPVDVRLWVRENLCLPEGTSLQRTFLEGVCFSLPVTVAWLLEEQGLRERKTAAVLRTEHYRSGLRWLDGVAAAMQTEVNSIERSVHLLAGRDGLFDHFRRRFDQARQSSIAAEEPVSGLRVELSGAEAALERLGTFQAELGELRREIAARRLTLAGLEGQAERWRHWQAVHERAVRAMHDSQEAWQAHQRALEEIGKQAAFLTGIEPLRQQFRTASANVMALRREQTLLLSQLAAIRQAETEAADLAKQVQQQQQLEQQLVAAQDRAIRLDLLNRSIQQTAQESKRVEVLLAEVDRQLADLEQLAPQAARVKRLEAELEDQQRLAREAGKQVDHLRFLETTLRVISGQLDDLRKGTAITERLAVRAGLAVNAVAAAGERTMASHLREAVDHQIDALEKQLRDWQAQCRGLADAPLRQNQLRSTLHQLEQEIAAARQVELKLGVVPALKQHRKFLTENVDQLRKITEAQRKEHQECSDAPARLSALRQELSSLKDPRSEREVLLRSAARKEAAEAELRQLQRALTDAELHEKSIAERLAGLANVQSEMAAQEHLRDDSLEGYATYLAQQAIAELASSADAELEAVVTQLEAQRHLQEQAEARETALLAEMQPLEDASLRVALLRSGITVVEGNAREASSRLQEAAEDFTAAERNRAELRSRQKELKTRFRAGALLQSARGSIEEAERVLGSRIRRELAEAASPTVACLLDDPTARLVWEPGEAPALTAAGSSGALDQLNPIVQASVALALRLALSTEASSFGTIFVSGTGPLLASDAMAQKLEALSGASQFLVVSAW